MYLSGGGDVGDVGRLWITRDLLASPPAGFSAKTNTMISSKVCISVSKQKRGKAN